MVYRQPAYRTRVVYRDRVRVVRPIRRDVVTTGAIGARQVTRVRVDRYR